MTQDSKKLDTVLMGNPEATLRLGIAVMVLHATIANPSIPNEPVPILVDRCFHIADAVLKGLAK